MACQKTIILDLVKLYVRYLLGYKLNQLLYCKLLKVIAKYISFQLKFRVPKNMTGFIF